MPGMRVLLRDLDDRETESLAPSRCHAWWLLGWLSSKIEHFVAGLEVEPVRDDVVRLAGVAGDDDLFRRDAQELGERFRVSSFASDSRARFCGDGSLSTLSRLSVSASSTGAEAGQRLAAFITARSGGMTNCARTLPERLAAAGPPPASAGAAGSWLAHAGSAKERRRSAEQPRKSRPKSRRETLNQS